MFLRQLTVGAARSRGGTLLGSEFAISISHCDPAVAYNSTNDQYLVVWPLAFSNGEEEILGRIIAWDGSGVGQAFVIWYWPQRVLTRPKVAWNSTRNEYFVIWNALATGSYIATDVSGTLVSAGGGLEGIAHHIQDYNSSPVNTYSYSPDADLTYNPSIYGGQNYLVVMRTGSNRGNGILRDIRMRIVSADGSVNPNAYDDIVPLGDGQFPGVATIGGVSPSEPPYFLVWEDLDPASFQARIEQELFDAYGQVLGPGALSLWADPMYVGPPAVAAPSGAGREFFGNLANADGPGKWDHGEPLRVRHVF